MSKGANGIEDAFEDWVGEDGGLEAYSVGQG